MQAVGGGIEANVERRRPRVEVGVELGRLRHVGDEAPPLEVAEERRCGSSRSGAALSTARGAPSDAVGIMVPHGIDEAARRSRRLASGGRRWFAALDRGGIVSLLVGAGVAVAALWAFTILPRSLPSVTALETFQPLRRHQDLRRQRRADHRAPRRAPDLRAARPDARRRCGTRSSPPRTAASTPTGASIPSASRAPSSRTIRRGRIVEGGSTITQQLDEGAVPHAGQEPRAQGEGGGAGAGAGAPLLEGPHPRDVPQPGLLRPRRLRRGGGGPDLLRQVGLGAQRARRPRCWPGSPARRPRTRRSSTARPPSAAARSCCAAWWTYGALKDADAKRLARADSASFRPSGAAPPGSTSSSTSSRRSRPSTAPTWCSRAGSTSTPRSVPTMQLTAEQALRDGLKALESRAAQRRPAPAAASVRRARVVTIDPPDRLRQGHGRRLRLLPQRVQPRRPGPPPARARPSSRSSTSPRWRRASRRPPAVEDAPVSYAGRRQRPGLEARELRPQVPRPDDAAAGARGVGQRRDR